MAWITIRRNGKRSNAIIQMHAKEFQVRCFRRVDWEEKVSKNNANAYRIATNSSAEAFESVEDHRKTILIIYVCIIIFTAICVLSRSLSFYELCVKASTNLHDMLFRSVSRAKMVFFNDNPSGRILNRFGGDISSIDSVLPSNIFEVTEVGSK